MNRKNTCKIVIAFAVVLALVLPSSAMFANIEKPVNTVLLVDNNMDVISGESVNGDMQIFDDDMIYDDDDTEIWCWNDVDSEEIIESSGGFRVDNWIHFDDRVNYIGIGLTSSGTFQGAIRITPDELGGYDNWKLTTVRWYHYVSCCGGSETHSGNIKIYGDGTATRPGTLVSSEHFTVTSPPGGAWYGISLSNPVTLDADEDVWVSVEITHDAGEHPIGVDDGPAVDGKGDWFGYGGTWTENQFTGLDYNWNIWAGVVDESTASDLDCEGSLSWNDVKTGETVTGSFKVKNIGDQESLLDWEIESYPDWGEWTFNPEDGEGLTPEDGPVMIEVEVVAPNQQNSNFTGEIKVVNQDDPDDFCIIEVTLITPYKSPFLQFFESLAQRFPIFALILDIIL